jgi:hypothetical protein
VCLLACPGKSLEKYSRENLAGAKMEFWTKKLNTPFLPFYNTNRHDKAWQDQLLVIKEKKCASLT